jgi:hypothetical protein
MPTAPPWPGHLLVSVFLLLTLVSSLVTLINSHASRSRFPFAPSDNDHPANVREEGNLSSSSSSRAKLARLAPWTALDSDPLPPWHGLQNDLAALAQTVAADDAGVGPFQKEQPSTVTVFPFNAKFAKSVFIYLLLPTAEFLPNIIALTVANKTAAPFSVP